MNTPRRVLLALVVLAPLIASDARAAWTGGGPEGGWVTRFVRPFGAVGPLYVGTYGGGIWRSDDDGTTWAPASPEAADAVVWDFARADDGRSSFYAASEDRGLLLSEGQIDRWFGVNAGIEGAAVFSVDTFPLDPARVVIGTDGGARISRTRGSAWRDSLRVGPVVQVRAVDVDPLTPNTVHYIAYESFGVYRGSRTPVVEVRAGLPPDRFLFDLAPLSGDDAHVVADLSGDIWRVDEATKFVGIGPDPGDGPEPRFYRVAITEGRPTRIRVGADRGLFVSDDGGATWDVTRGGSFRATPEVWDVFVDDPATESLWLGSFHDGALRAVGDEPWVPSNAGLRATWVRAVDVYDGVTLIGTAHGSVHRSLDDGATWTDVTGDLDGSQVGMVWAGEGRWILDEFDDTWTSTDGGQSWVPLPLPVPASRLLDVVERDDGSLIGLSDGGALRSDDGGASWVALAGLPTDREAVAAASRGNTSVIVFDGPRLFVGAGNGPWEEITLGLLATTTPAGVAFDGSGIGSCVVALPTDSDGNLVFVTGLDDPATAAVRRGRAGPATSVVDPSGLVRVPRTEQLVLSSKDEGVFVSDDAGATWTQANDGLVSKRIEDLAVDPVGTSGLVVGTLARGAWTLPVDPALSIDDETGPEPGIDVTTTRLFAPAPNPFHPRTSIRWAQTRTAPVAIDVFDLRGRWVRTLLEDTLGAGRHAIGWDGRDARGVALGAGTYLVRARIGGRTFSTRVTLLR